MMKKGGLVLLALVASACATTTTRPLEWRDCAIKDAPGARCTTLAVPENWSTRRGRTIDLNVVVLPATAAAVRDPIVPLQGGPGQGATRFADFYGRAYAGARATRDIVLVDQRGTGASNPLRCDMGTSLDLFPVDAVRRCREELSKTSDLARYTTADAVKDLEAVRTALGYGQLNLYGTSYGTRVAFEYARAYPQQVRTMTLKGVAPPGLALPSGFAGDVERALMLLIEDCEADATCRTKFHSLRQDYRTMRSRLLDPEKVGDSTITQGQVAAATRSLLQSTGGASELPRLIAAAADYTWEPYLDVMREIRRQVAESVSSGLMLSVACSEDAPFLDRATIESDARDTLLGTYWYDQLTAACAEWPRATVDRVMHPPLTLEIPTLIISGNLDPATPPRNGEQAAAMLPRSRHIVVKYGSHSFAGMSGCVDKLMTEFVEKGDATGLDASCVEKIRRPAFK